MLCCSGGDKLGEFQLSPSTRLVVAEDSSKSRHAQAWSTFRSFHLETGSSGTRGGGGGKTTLTLGSDNVIELELWMDALGQAMHRLQRR